MGEVRLSMLAKQGAEAPGIKKASVETDASKCAQPGGLWQGLTGGAVIVGALFAAAVVATETPASTTVMTAATAAIIVIETALLAALTVLFWAALILAFRARTKLRATVFAAVITTITATTASAAMLLATTVTTAIAAFITSAFAGTFVLLRGWCGLGLHCGIATEKTFQPTKEAGFFGFGDGGRGFWLKRALLTTFAGLLLALTEWFAAFAWLFATGFAWAKLVARILRLFATGRPVIAADRLIVAARRTEIRATFATRVGTGGRLCGLTTNFPALRRADVLLGREDFEFGFGFNDHLGGGLEGFDRS